MLNRGSRFGQEEEEVKPDLSPMIDCIFILLIFFIVTTVFVEESGVEVTRPEASTATAAESNSILIAITSDNKIFYGGKEYRVNGLQSLVKEKLAEDEEMPVILQGDTKASHGIVTQVYDQCKAAGATKITTATN